ERLPKLAEHNPLALIVGDLNVGHRTLDIKNWKGNVKRAGFLPEERAYFDRFLGAEDEEGYNAGAGLGWVDVGRRWAGEVPGPYVRWWQRGRASGCGAAWRSAYHRATPALAGKFGSYPVARAAA